MLFLRLKQVEKTIKGLLLFFLLALIHLNPLYLMRHEIHQETDNNIHQDIQTHNIYMSLHEGDSQDMNPNMI